MSHGNQILTSNGTVVILRGVDYTYFIDGPCGSWMLPNGQIEFNTWDTAALNSNLDAIKSWGCNSSSCTCNNSMVGTEHTKFPKQLRILHCTSSFAGNLR